MRWGHRYGGHNWHPMSFSPITNLVYIPVIENGMIYAQEGDFRYDPNAQNMAIDFNHLFDDDAARKDNTRLVAWDPIAGEERWEVDHQRSGASGVLATAGGVVFQPGSDCSFKAFDAGTGAMVWETTVQMSTIAAPVSYEVDGEQYVAFLSGWGGAAGIFSSVPCADGKRTHTGRLLAYKLGGSAQLPPAREPAPVPEPPPRMTLDAAEMNEARALFLKFCWNCHSVGADTHRIIPNLAHMSQSTHDQWDAIVLGGARQNKGMISFTHVLSAAQSRAIQAFVIDQAHKAWGEQP